MSKRNYMKNKEGLRKIRTFIDEQQTVMMASNLDTKPFSVCPMTVQQMDEQGDLWFFVSRESGLYKDIEDDNRIQIIYSDDKKQQYLSIFGNATHIIAEQKKDELWNCNLLNWFEGKDDPNLALLSVHMENAFYWDNENSRLVPFFDLEEDVASGSAEKGFVNL
jgi:general stress protein 26